MREEILRGRISRVVGRVDNKPWANSKNLWATRKFTSPTTWR